MFPEDAVSDLFGQMEDPGYFNEGFSMPQGAIGGGEAPPQQQGTTGKSPTTKTKAQQLLSSAYKANKGDTRRVSRSELRNMLSQGVSAKDIKKGLKGKSSGYIGSKASKFLSNALEAQKAGKPVPTGKPKAQAAAKPKAAAKPSQTKQRAAVVSKYKTQTAQAKPTQARPAQAKPAQARPAQAKPAAKQSQGKKKK